MSYDSSSLVPITLRLDGDDVNSTRSVVKGDSATSSLLNPSEAVREASICKQLALVEAFQPRDFVPVWWGKNAHTMTIISTLEGALFDRAPAVEYRRVWLETPDGDNIAVDFLDAPTGTLYGEWDRPIVVLALGLESKSDAPFTKRIALAYARRGYDVCVCNYRSCAGGNDIPRKPGGYHLGFTQDLNFLTKELFNASLDEGRRPGRRIYLSGFSLGGNIILKLLGELGDEAQQRNGIVGAAVCCVPFHPADTEPLLASGVGKSVYSANFLRSLREKATRQVEAIGADAFPKRFSLANALASTTTGEWDEAYLAPIYGFRSKEEYYQTQGCASGGYLRQIRVPALAVNALDDPFMNPNTLPSPTDRADRFTGLGPVAPVKLVYHAQGGHCGFVSAQPPAQAASSSLSSTKSGPPLQCKDWLPEELARFIEHCETSYLRSQATSY